MTKADMQRLAKSRSLDEMGTRAVLRDRLFEAGLLDVNGDEIIVKELPPDFAVKPQPSSPPSPRAKDTPDAQTSQVFARRSRPAVPKPQEQLFAARDYVRRASPKAAAMFVRWMEQQGNPKHPLAAWPGIYARFLNTPVR